MAGWRGYAAAAAGAAMLAGGATWAAKGWRLGERIALLERDQERGRANANAVALGRLTIDLQTISEAARRAAADASALPGRIGIISRALKDAIPLPAGCRPDDLRVRSLTDAVRAANDTAAGQPTGSAVPGASRPAAAP
ncbi:hypothetical protein ANT3_1650 [plant metagenome]|uniref:Uncharacterized protein n=1 Tax=plant metagenome TaxID=1297885 RepID=A0A484S908_9ZZZZ